MRRKTLDGAVWSDGVLVNGPSIMPRRLRTAPGTSGVGTSGRHTCTSTTPFSCRQLPSRVESLPLCVRARGVRACSIGGGTIATCADQSGR